MLKILKIIGIAVLVIVQPVAGLFVRAALTPAAPKNYTETVKTGGPIESTYLKNGSYSISYSEQKTDTDYKKFEIWYPEELKDSDRKFPVIVVLNGTGVKASKYKSQFEHFASWGFIAIGTEEEEAWDGAAAEDSLAYLLKCNDDPRSIFYQKIDTDNIGTVGHSQGGAGVLNTLTEHEHSGMYKTGVPLSPTNEEQTAALGWYYNLTRIKVPVLLLAGTAGDFEMELVISDEDMKSMYAKLNCPKVMARKLDCEHGHMLYSADGYVTAWFMWLLQGDPAAAEAFAGDDPELLRNILYRDQKTDLNE